MRYLTILFFLFVCCVATIAQTRRECYEQLKDCFGAASVLEGEAELTAVIACIHIYNDCRDEKVVTLEISANRLSAETPLLQSGLILEEGGLYPNPTNGMSTLNYLSVRDSEVAISIRDVSGRLLLEELTSVREGEGTLEINIEDMVSGVYFVNISNGEFYETFKIIKK